MESHSRVAERGHEVAGEPACGAGRTRLRDASQVASALLGLPLSTHTAVPIANTAVPVWHDARRILPAVFAAGAVVVPVEWAGPARRVAIISFVAQIALLGVMERRLGFIGEPYRNGQARIFGRLGKGSRRRAPPSSPPTGAAAAAPPLRAVGSSWPARRPRAGREGSKASTATGGRQGASRRGAGDPGPGS